MEVVMEVMVMREVQGVEGMVEVVADVMVEAEVQMVAEVAVEDEVEVMVEEEGEVGSGPCSRGSHSRSDHACRTARAARRGAAAPPRPAASPSAPSA